MSGIIGKNASRSSGVIGTSDAGIASLAADSSPQLGGFLDAAGNYIQMEKGGDISSASPTVIDTDGDYFDVTGTTNFAAFTVAADRHFFIQFDGALTMTHHATNLDLPGGANITTVAGDVAEFFSTGANTVQCVNYTKADGTAVVLADNSITLAKMAGGTDGQVITYDASGDPVAVGPGTDGQVLTSTGAGSPPAFEDAAGGGLPSVGAFAYTDSGQVITTGTWTKRVFDTEWYDFGADYDNSTNYRFTSDTEGKYLITLADGFGQGLAANKIGNHGIYVSGGIFCRTSFSPGIALIENSFSTTWHDNTGSQYYEAYIEHNNGSNRTADVGVGLSHLVVQLMIDDS